MFEFNDAVLYGKGFSARLNKPSVCKQSQVGFLPIELLMLSAAFILGFIQTKVHSMIIEL